MNQKGLTSVVYVLILLLVTGGIVGISLYFKNKISNSQKTKIIEVTPSPITPQPSISENGSCTNDSQCSVGYKCVQGCGGPVSRADDPPAGYFCQPAEQANKPRNCPICLASNTQISTPNGDVNVRDLKIGMKVFSEDKQGKKIIVDIIKVSSTPTPKTHQVIHLILADGRQLWVSPNHPTILGVVANLQIGQIYDGSTIRGVERVSYWDNRTYDLLPQSETGFYFANGILMGSTLKSSPALN